MKTIVFALIALSTIATETRWGVPEEDHVAVLTPANFNDFIKKHKYAFVEFYAPWCGHCQELAPIYSKLALRMKEVEDGPAIAKLDAAEEEDFAEEQGIEGFPTLKLFIDGEPIDYDGEREEEDMFKWLMKKMGPSATELTSSEELQKQKEEENVIVVMYMSKDEEENLKTYMNVASTFDGVSFVYCHNEEMKKEVSEEKYVLRVIRVFDDEEKILAKGEMPTKDEMMEFVESNRFPLIMELTEASADRIFGSESPAMFLLSDNLDDPAYNVFEEFAKKNPTRIFYCTSGVTDDFGSRLAEFLGVEEKDQPAIRIIKFEGNNINKYVIDDISAEGLELALGLFEEGNLVPHLKSEPIPETNNEPVKKVVGNNFQEMVIDNDNYVLLEAYAPWCGHCQELEPIYKELAEKVAGVEKLVIAKIDATLNEHSSLEVEGFPTILLFKPGEKDMPLDYQGERTMQDMLDYLKKETGLELEETPVKSEEL